MFLFSCITGNPNNDMVTKAEKVEVEDVNTESEFESADYEEGEGTQVCTEKIPSNRSIVLLQ